MTTPRRASLWLAAPTRFAGLPLRRAQLAAALVLALLLACFTALPAPAPPPGQAASAPAEERSDIALYRSIVAGVAAGGDYYDVAAAALRADGYPLRPFVTVRLPTLARVQAMLPEWLTVGLLFALAALTVAVWYRRLAPAFARTPPRLVAGVLAIGGLSAFIRPDLVAFHEEWAGPLVALSLATWRPGKPTTAIALALAAMLIRETAALYAAVMALAALVDGRRRECLGWVAALGVLAAAVGAHAWAVAQVVRDTDLASPGWSGMLGPGFFVKTMVLATSLSALPMAIAAPLVGLALAGWAAWRDPLAVRVLATLGGYALLLALFARPDTYYWGLLAAPLVPIGLAFAPDALRDLARGVRQRPRRITVTRTAR